MKPLARNLAVVAVAALAFAPAGARAQWYSSYSQQAPQQPYAVEVAPGTYVIQRPAAPRPRAATHRHVRRAARKARARVHNDPALIEELRRRNARHMAKQERRHRRHKVDRTVTVKGKVKIVRGKPRVVVHRRVVDDPPRVIVRPHLIDEMPRKRGLFAPPPQQIERDLPPYVERGPVTLPRSWHPEPDHRAPHAVRHTARRKPHRQIKRHKSVRHVERRKAPPPAASRKAIARGTPADERTIKAEAEVTILGPDRMMIRLYRKGDAPAARTN